MGAHGSPSKYVHEVVGVNSRLDTVQAVVLNAKLSAWRGGTSCAGKRQRGIPNCSPTFPACGYRSGPYNEDVWHLYVVRTSNRDEILAQLNESGVGAGIHYPAPVHLTPAYAHLALPAGSFPVAERAATEILSLPLYPHITTEQQNYVANTLRSAVACFMAADRTERAGGPALVGP